MDLLTQDAEAGNEVTQEVLLLLENRKQSEKICVIGKPFNLDLLKQVDKALLEKDAEAGYQPALDILHLSNMRTLCQKYTKYQTHYPKNFFDLVDKELLIKDADAGNSESQYIWARLNDLTYGFKDDPKLRFKYYTMASDQDNARAMMNLASAYYNGQGTRVDGAKGFSLQKRAAELGYLPMMHIMGRRYLTDGIGYKQDLEKSFEWFKKAADLGYADSQYVTGETYFFGRNIIKKDRSKGVAYIKLAAEQFHKDAIYRYPAMLKHIHPKEKYEKLVHEYYKYGSDKNNPYCKLKWVEALLTGVGAQKDVAHAKKLMIDIESSGDLRVMNTLASFYWHGKGEIQDTKKAVQIYEGLVDKGYVYSMNSLGNLYRQGKGNVEKNPKLSAQYYLTSYNEKGYKGIAHILAEYYREGFGVEKDIPKSLELLEDGVQHNEGGSLNSMGELYLQGNLVEQDPQKAIDYFNKAVADDNSDAMLNLAKLQFQGEHMPFHRNKAVRLINKAIEKNNSTAMFEMANYTSKGLYGMKKDISKAKSLYKQAIDLGHKEAKKALNKLSKRKAK